MARSDKVSKYKEMMKIFPSKVFLNIFGYLDLKDVISLRLISKEFRQFIEEEFEVLELIFDHNFTREFWFYSNLPQDFRNRFNISEQKFLLKPLFKIKKLKRLKLSKVGYEFNLKNLNELNQLVELEIDLSISQDNSDEINKLELANLKVLNLKFINTLVLKLPKLKALYLTMDSEETDNSTYPIIIDNPLTLRYLRVDAYRLNLPIFRNIEFLEIDNAIKLEKKSFLSLFPRLKKLRIRLACKESIEHQLDQKIALKKDDLKIYYNGYHLTDKTDLTNVDWTFFNDYFLIRRYYQKLDDNIHWRAFLNYNALNFQFPNWPRVGFFNKFNNIQAVHVINRIYNSSLLVQFIKGCKNLFELALVDTNLGQSFYDHELPKNLINCLIIFESEPANRKLDFKFMNEMCDVLTDLTTNLELTLNKDLKFEQFKYLNTICLKINGKEVIINKDDGDKRFYFKEEDCEKFGVTAEKISYKELERWQIYLKKKIKRTEDTNTAVSRSKFKRLKIQHQDN